MTPFRYRDNLLFADDIPVDAIAYAVGTPCYVYSRTALEENYMAIKNGFGDRNASVFYSVKANSNLAVIALMAKLGSGFDIVSGGELHRVLRAGGNPNKTIFSGVGKSEDEIRFALQSGIFSLNLESEAELDRICTIARELEITAPVSVRVNPDIDAKTHPHISTGMREAKFGVPLDQAKKLYARAQSAECLRIVGIAMHIGSQITAISPIIDALEILLDFTDELKDAGIVIDHLDLGGGLGVRYRAENVPTVQQYCDAITEALERRNCKINLSVEPGRSIAAPAGILLCRIELIKHTDEKNFAVVDGAMNDLIRPVLYNAWMDIIPSVRNDHLPESVYDVVGPICESGDYLGKDRKLKIDTGASNLLAVCGAGAYGAVMSSNYNSRPKPPEVMVFGDHFKIIRERESIDDLIALESIPQDLIQF